MTDYALALYRRLFVHREDVFAQQNPDRSYTPVRRPLEDADLAAHNAGTASYGVYVIDPGWREPQPTDGPEYHQDHAQWEAAGPHPANTVRYLMFDLDTYDAGALDCLTRSVQQLVGSAIRTSEGWDYKCLILEDSGGKGYHIWLLLAEPMPAALARAWAEPVRRTYATLRRTAPDWPPLEIFPKQDTVPEGGYGNLVKLPFGVHAATHTRALLVPVDGWARSLEDVRPYNPADVPAAPQAPQKALGGLQGSSPSPFPCITRILEEGAGQGVRDNAMYHLARYARSCGLPDDLVEDWCLRANEQFGPPLSDEEVRTKVHSALAATNANPGCRADWLQEFCPGGERCYAPWSKPRAQEHYTDQYPVDGTDDERRAWRERHAGA